MKSPGRKYGRGKVEKGHMEKLGEEEDKIRARKIK